MNEMISYTPASSPLPVSIDYTAALALCRMAMLIDDLPKYLLAPEVSALLHYVPDLHRKMLLTTLWNTGARINKALVLTREDFLLRQQYLFVQLATLKQREEGGTPCRTPIYLDRDASPGAPFRRSVRDAAGDDDRHPVDSARAAQRVDWPDGKGPAVGGNRSHRPYLAK